MADYEVKIIISGDNAAAVKAMQETVDKLKGLDGQSKNNKKGTDELKNSMMNFVEGAVSATAVIKFLSDSFMEFSKSETAVLEYNQTLKYFGNYTEDASKKAQQFASTMQNMVGFTDEQILAAGTYGQNLGIATAQIQDATDAAIGLSAALGLDLNTSMKLSQAYIEGNTQKMTRLLPALQNMTSDTEKLAFVQDKMNAGFQMAQARMDGSQGSWTRLKNTVNDFQEMYGGMLSKYITPSLNVIEKVIRAFINWDSPIKDVLLKFNMLIGPLEMVKGIIELLERVFITFKDPIMDVVDAIEKFIKKIEEKLKPAFDKIKNAIDEVNKWFIKHGIELKKIEKQNDDFNKKQQLHLQSNYKINKEYADNMGALDKEEFERRQKYEDAKFKATADANKKAYETKKEYIQLGLQAGLDAAMAEGATVAKVLGAVLRAEAKQLSESLLIKAVAAFASLNIPMGIAYTAGAGAVLAAGGAAASAIENNPIKLFKEGGVINEPIFGVGRSGQRYMFGEAGKEVVTPISQSTSTSHSITIQNLNVKTNNARDIMNGLYEIQRRTNTRMMKRG